MGRGCELNGEITEWGRVELNGWRVCGGLMRGVGSITSTGSIWTNQSSI